MRQSEGQGSCAAQDTFSSNHYFRIFLCGRHGGLHWLVPALPNHVSSFPTLPLPSPFSCLSFLPFFPPLSSPLSSVFLSFTQPPGRTQSGSPTLRKRSLVPPQGTHSRGTPTSLCSYLPGHQIQGPENESRQGPNSREPLRHQGRGK